MPGFKDANGREWLVELDAFKIRDIRTDLKFDLAPPDRNPFDKLEQDPVLVCDVLWMLVRDQKPDPNYTDADFGRALKGDAMAAGTEALIEAVLSFSPPQRRGAMRKAMEATREVREAGLALALDRLADPDILAKLKTTMADAMDRQIAAAMTGLQSAFNTPASSESNPAEKPSPS